MLDKLSIPTSCASLVMLTIIVAGMVCLAQLTGVDGAKDVNTDSGKPIANLCTAVASCCPSFSNSINLSNDSILQDGIDASTAGGNIYILWKEPVEPFGQGPLFLVKSTDNGHTFGSKTEVVNEVYNSNIASYGNNVYIIYHLVDGAYLIKSEDGGNSFGSPIKLNQLNGITKSNAYNDADIKIAAFGNSVYVMWSEITGKYDDLFFIKSTDGGSTFSDKKNLSADIGQSGWPNLEVAGNNVYVSWTNISGGQSNYEIFYKRSIDGGNSFGKKINLSNDPEFSTDPYVGAFGNNVYAAWEEGHNIILKKSSDGGHTFGSKKVITTSGWRPLLDVSPDNKVYLVWRHSKAEPKPFELDILLKRSIDEGASFSCFTKVAKSLTDTIYEIRLISSDDRLSVLWTNKVNIGEDNENSEVYFRATPP